MSVRNVDWLRKEVCRMLNIDVNAPDQAFSKEDVNPWAEIDSALTEAYEQELEEAILETDSDWFFQGMAVTWPVSQRTLELPAELQGMEILRVDDETHDQPGIMLVISSRAEQYEPEISWADYKTLQWGFAGPVETKTLKFFYLAHAPELNDPVQEPIWIPSQFRRLLVWTASIVLRKRVAEEAPQQWLQEQEAWRMRFHLSLSRGRPRDTNRPQIMNVEPKGGFLL